MIMCENDITAMLATAFGQHGPLLRNKRYSEPADKDLAK
jgi:hypothetical protein